MKDAQGHGSDSTGNLAQTGRGPAAHSSFLIQKLNPALVGNPWQTVARMKNQATAERVAQHMRTDDRSITNRVRR
jgi:hypothetical protein